MLFLLWLHPFILSGVISPLITSSILGTYQPREFIFQCPIFLPFHIVHVVPKARILKWFAIPFSRDEQCRWWEWDSLSVFYGLSVYFKFKILFYTFIKTLGQRFGIFCSPSPWFIISTNHCYSSNRVPASVILSLIIYYLPPLKCPIVNLWLHSNSCYIPQFTTYLPKSCLPLTSWAHYLLKRWEYQTILLVSWETCMWVKKQQLEPWWNNWLVQDWERSTTGLSAVSLFI